MGLHSNTDSFRCAAIEVVHFAKKFFFNISPCALPPFFHRVVIAEWQNIVYSEYLPTILGPSGLQRLGDYHGYDPDTNPAIANVFATAAFRFGHGQILPFFNRLNTSYQPGPQGPLQLRQAFFAPFRLLEEGGIDPLLRGLLATAGKRRTPHSGLNSNLTEALFEQVIGQQLHGYNYISDGCLPITSIH